MKVIMTKNEWGEYPTVLGVVFVDEEKAVIYLKEHGFTKRPDDPWGGKVWNNKGHTFAYLIEVTLIGGRLCE